jgi:hypothetical protein
MKTKTIRTMKTLFGLLSVMALLCGGCGRQNDEYIAKLQQQLDTLTATCASLQTTCSNLQATCDANANATASCLFLEQLNQANMRSFASATNFDLLFASQALLDKRMAAIEKSPAGKAP